MKLIDSLFRHFYVPPVLLAEVEEEDGSKVQRVVDGKQRLTSIQNFLDGMVRLKLFQLRQLQLISFMTDSL